MSQERIEKHGVDEVISKRDKKAIIKKAMMRVYDRIESAKITCSKDNDLIKPKWLTRIKNQGFDKNRRLVICYKTHKNILSEDKTDDYVIMSKVMIKIQEYFEISEDVKGRLYYELNKIVIRFSYLKQEKDA